MYEYITFDDVREISHLLSFEKESYTVDIYIKNNNAARILKEMIEKLSGIKAENFSTHYQFNNRKVIGVQCVQNVPIVFWIGFAVPGIFIGCNQFKI